MFSFVSISKKAFFLYVPYDACYQNCVVTSTCYVIVYFIPNGSRTLLVTVIYIFESRKNISRRIFQIAFSLNANPRKCIFCLQLDLEMI